MVRLTVSKSNLNKVLKDVENRIRVVETLGDELSKEYAEKGAQKAGELYAEAKYDGSKAGIKVEAQKVRKGLWQVSANGPGAVINSIEYGASSNGAHDYYFYSLPTGNEFKAGGAHAHYKKRAMAYQSKYRTYSKADLQSLWDQGKLPRDRVFRGKKKPYRDLEDFIENQLDKGNLTLAKTGYESVEKEHSGITKGNPPNHVMNKTAEYIAEELPKELKRQVRAKISK